MVYSKDNFNKLANKAKVWSLCQLASQTPQVSSFTPPNPALTHWLILNHSQLGYKYRPSLPNDGQSLECGTKHWSMPFHLTQVEILVTLL